MSKKTLMQIRVLLWKHCLVRRRCWAMTIFELIIPLSIVLLLRVSFFRFSNISHNKVSYVQETESIPDHYLYQRNAINNVYYSPNESDFVRSLMEDVSYRLNLGEKSMTGFENERTLFRAKGKTLRVDQDSLAVIFESTKDIHRKINYTIRNLKPYKTSRIIPAEIVPGPHEHYGEIYFSFVTLQLAIDTSFIEKISRRNLTKNLEIQPYPYPPYVRDDFSILKYEYLLPLFIVNSFLFLFLIDVSRILTEKASGMKELMKTMGLSKNILWISYYINSLVIYLIVVVGLVCILQISDDPLIPKSNPFIVGISLLLCTNYMILLSFAVTTLFSESLHACIATSALWIVFQLPVRYSYVFLHNHILSTALTVNPNILLFWMLKIIGIYEMKDDGLQWHNLLSSPSIDVSISLGFVWLLLLLHIMGLTFLTWYMDQVNPGVHGVPKPMFFIFQRDYWCPKVDPFVDIVETDNQQQEYFEDFSETTDAGIIIDNVWKVYKSRLNVHALSGVSFKVYKDGITALLGHNGAGKTTLMSIITGMISPTKGSVRVNGMDTKKNIDEIRLSLGMCPQHNVTFSDLTVREHIIFFAKLKGISLALAKKECDEILTSVKLNDKGSAKCSQLSCGMKRRVQLAMALVGKASVLVLDEPTSGLDPEMRRELWDILISLKKSHTLLISTHSLEEADVLADRVVIMSRGRLKCYGTPSFLKKAYGTGYNLHLVSKLTLDANILSMIEERVKGLPVTYGKNENTIAINIPEESKMHLGSIFSLIKENKEIWGFDTIQLTSTTLEDVFLRVTDGSEAFDKPWPVENDKACNMKTFSLQLDDENNQYANNNLLMRNRAEGLWEKKFIHIKISRYFFILQIFFAIIFSCTSLIASKASQPNDDNPKLGLTLSVYKNKILHVLYSNDGSGQKYFSIFKERFQQVDNVYTGVLEEGRKNTKNYIESIPIALDFTNNSYTGLYSTSVYHALPIVVNTLTNLLATEMNVDGNGTQVISVNNYPITNDSLEKLPKDMEKSFSSILLWVSGLTIGAFILEAIFMPFPINERNSFSRRLQQMTGTPPYLYWLITFVFDFIICFIICNIMLFIDCSVDSDPSFRFITTYAPLLVHLSFHITAGLFFVYSLSLFMKNSATGYVILLLIVLLSSLISLILFFEAMSISSLGMGDILRDLFRLLPSFCFNYGLLKIGVIASQNSGCLRRFGLSAYQSVPKDLCCGKDEVTNACTGLKSYFFDLEYGIYRELLFFSLSTVFLVVFLMISEYKVCQILFSRGFKTQHQETENQPKDDDVKDEITRLTSETSGLALGLDHIVKRYQTILGKRTINAVNDVSIGINRGECFGLLGVNGAGKTTVFKMLMREVIPTSGSIRGYSCGYCPEFDAIDKFLTSRQVLTLFCQLRGISKKACKEEVNNMLEMTGLMELADVQNGTYSGGNRRKLSVAISLIGYKEGVVLLDEPTSGVDPHSRRILHQVISNAKKQRKSIIISSHSMDECEKLCDRLAIMAKGTLVCIGNLQHLKKKFSQGVYLTVKLKATPTEPECSISIDEIDSAISEIDSEETRLVTLNKPISELKVSIQNAFDCDLTDETTKTLQYHIKNNEGYTELFSKMEEIKHDNPGLLEDYMINDSSLEEVFMSIARQQSSKATNLPKDTIA